MEEITNKNNVTTIHLEDRLFMYADGDGRFMNELIHWRDTNNLIIFNIDMYNELADMSDKDLAEFKIIFGDRMPKLIRFLTRMRVDKEDN